MKKERKCQEVIQQAVEPTADTRSKKTMRWVKRLVPIGLFVVMAAASATILVKNLRTVETEQPEQDVTDIATELSVMSSIPIDPTECVTVGGLVWSRIFYSSEPKGTTVELVTNATEEALIGCPACRTADGTRVSVTASNGQIRWYTYFGRADEKNGVVDDCLAEFLQGSGIPNADSIFSVTVFDSTRDVETEQGNGLVSYTLYRKEISDPATIQSIYNLLADLPRDMADYAAACEGDAPYEGDCRLLLQTRTREIQLILYPKISYVWGGYRFQPDTLEGLQTILSDETNT